MSQKWLNDVVQINKSKAGKIYIKFTDNSEVLEEFKSRLKPGGMISCKSKQTELDEALEAGRISEERHEELVDKLSFIKYVGHMGPDRD